MVALATTSPGRHLWSPGRRQIGQVNKAKAIMGQGSGHSLLAGQAEREGAVEGALLITGEILDF